MKGGISYLSGPWFALLEQEAARASEAAGAGAGTDAAPSGPLRDFVLVERYPDCPLPGFAPLDPGFRIEFHADGRVAVRPGAKADEPADCTLVMDWQAARALVSQYSGEGLDALLADLITGGRLQVTGDMNACPVDLGAFHDAVVRATSVDA